MTRRGARAGWRWLMAAPLALVMVAATGDTVPQVVLATPGSDSAGSATVNRFTLRFSESMVPLGDPRSAAPATQDCGAEATGRWTDDRTFVFDFAAPLAGGKRCAVTLRDGLETLNGRPVTGARSFAIDTGGPAARAVLDGGGDAGGGGVEERQVFLVATNTPADRASVARFGYCAVDGIGEKIALDVLPAATAEEILTGLGRTNWQAESFLTDAGLPAPLPPAAADRAAALARVMAVQCRRPLPPGRDMALVWDARIAQAGAPARLVGRDQRFDFKVRSAFTAQFECRRVNAAAGCSPVEGASVRFSAPVPRAMAEGVRLRLADGTLRAPRPQSGQISGEVSRVDFSGPFPESIEASVVLPGAVTDLSGRPLANAARFPLPVRFDAAPPLVKFAAPFGIIEARAGAMLPVTVRGVEPRLAQRVEAVSGAALRIEGSDGAVAEWLRRVDAADDNDFREEAAGRGPDGKPRTRTVNYTGATPLLARGAGRAMTLDLPGGGKAFEVVGVPLEKPGFYVVELASPALGEALLGRKGTRYVAAGALVTNLSVHFKWGREASLAWVTALDSGQPVAGAAVAVSDSCTGRILARGTSDAAGRLIIARGLPRPETYGDCDGEPSVDGSGHPLMVSARSGDDFSFTLTDWGDGIRPYDFDLPYGWSERGDIVHTVFDRALVKAGESVAMKHIARRPVGTGFAMPAVQSGTLALVHRGSGTEFTMNYSIGADGVGENDWAVPASAPMGDYDLVFVTRDAKGEEQRRWSDQSIRVDEYRLPTMKATISGPATPPVRPSSVPLSLYAGYLSGGGAGALPVALRTSFAPEWGAPDGYDGWDFGGAAVAEGTVSLDDNGETPDAPLPPAATLPVTLDASGTARTSIDLARPIDDVTVMSVEMDYADANGETLTATRRIRLFPAAVRVGVKTDGWLMRDSDLRLNLVTLDLDGRPVRGQTVDVAVYSRTILTARRRLIGGFYAYDNQQRTERLSATCAARTDRQGRALCRLAPGVSGEVTVVATTRDAAGNVSRAVRSVWLAGADDWWFGGDNGDRMDVIPEQPRYAAGTTARLQVRMPFREATALVTVEREGVLASFVTTLKGTDPVIAVPLPATYAPDVYVSVLAVRGRVTGEESWFRRMKRAVGFQVELSEGAPPTALVDLAKPAYRLGIARLRVGEEGHRLRVKVTPDKARYAVRDTASVDVAVTTPSGKPAAGADMAFVAVDEALLQLAPNDSWQLLDAMMGTRTLDVLTSTAQMQVVGKRHYGRKALAPGGGGGGDFSGLTRQDFRPVLLWRGRVTLDDRGRARLSVPLSDSLSAFRMVAIATSGPQLFGTGEASVRTVQDLGIFTGLPPVVRTGDEFGATFTLRNGTDRPMKVVATPRVDPAVATGDPLTVTIPAGGAVPVNWTMTAPATPGTLTWTIEAVGDKARDRITATQTVIPAVPVESWAATLVRVGDAANIAIAPPAGALPGGSVDIRLSPTLAPPLDGVRAYMAAYSHACFEQQLSKAVVAGDGAAWTTLAAALPTYLDDDGLVRYFPSDRLPGSPELTAYVLAMTAAAGFELPQASRDAMVRAMTALVEGRLTRDTAGPSDDRLLRVAALTALARNGASSPALVRAAAMAPADMPTGTLADWLVAIDRTAGLANAPALRGAALAELRRRLVYEGTRLDLVDDARAPWWMMVSDDDMAIRATDAVLGQPGWQDDEGRMMVGVAARQRRGHWDTTPANAWGAILVRRFAARYPATAIAGTTSAMLGSASAAANWPLDAGAAPLSLPLATGTLALRHAGGTPPWATISVRAAVALTKPMFAGYRISRSVSVVSAKVPGRLTRGDVVKVRLDISATAARNWVVLADPIPPGATIVGALGGQSDMLAAEAEGDGTPPSWVERGRDGWRGYWAWLPQGSTRVEYVVRLNGSGRFSMPPTRIEAMYAPEIHAALPNAPVAVAFR